MKSKEIRTFYLEIKRMWSELGLRLVDHLFHKVQSGKRIIKIPRFQDFREQVIRHFYPLVNNFEVKANCLYGHVTKSYVWKFQRPVDITIHSEIIGTMFLKQK